MYKHVKATEATVRQIAANKTAANFITKDICPDLSFATKEPINYYHKQTTPYTRIYYVLEGVMTLTIDGNDIEVNIGDVCYLEKDTTYEMRGSFKAVTVNQPAFGSK
jgi:mannose-6-phosphate isomerase-like protein (cupin superfamily)